MKNEKLLRLRKMGAITPWIRLILGGIFVCVMYLWPLLLTTSLLKSAIDSISPLPPNTIPDVPVSILYPLLVYPILGLLSIFIEGLASLPYMLGMKIIGNDFTDDSCAGAVNRQFGT